MSDQPLHALLAVYPNRTYGDAAVTHVQQLEASNLLHLEGIAVVEKDLDGKVTAEVVGGPSGKSGAVRGSTIGLAVGLIFPAAMLPAALVGAGIGGLAGRRGGPSGRDEALQGVGERLERGRVGVIVLGGDEAVDLVAERLTGYESVHRRRVDPQTLAVLAEEVEPAAEG